MTSTELFSMGRRVGAFRAGNLRPKASSPGSRSEAHDYPLRPYHRIHLLLAAHDSTMVVPMDSSAWPNPFSWRTGLGPKRELEALQDSQVLFMSSASRIQAY